MTMPSSVRHIFPVRIQKEEGGGAYDADLVALGYESRSRAIAEEIPVKSKKPVAFGFAENQIFDYLVNRQWYEEHQYAVIEARDDEFRGIFESVLQNVLDTTEGAIRVRVDISSFTRPRLASIVSSFSEAASGRTITAEFAYTLAAFSPPPKELFPNIHVGPVLPDFAGWWTEPERPIVAIVGVGYEENKALGAVEHVQASQIWLFLPASPVKEYSPELQRANATLFDIIDKKYQYLYHVSQPFDSFARLESLTSGLLRNTNPIIFPFGPKIFALNALLVASIHPEVAVWRVSGAEELINRTSSGMHFGLGVVFGPASDSKEQTAEGIPSEFGVQSD